MKAAKLNDKTMIRYLLGEMSEEEREQLEVFLFDHHDLFEQLEVVEDELIESYVYGELKKHVKERFEQAYLTTPHRRRKVEHAEAVLSCLSKEPSLVSLAKQWLFSRLQLFWDFFFAPTRTRQLAFLSILLAVISYSIWLNYEQNILHRQITDMSSEHRTLLEEKQNLEQAFKQQQGRLNQINEQLLSEQKRSTQLENELNSQKPALPTFLLAELQIGVQDMTRRQGQEELKPKIISKNAQLVQVRLYPKEIDKYESFDAVLETDKGVVWGQYRLQGKQMAKGKAIVLLIPMNVFSEDDDYILRLVPSDSEQFEEIVSYTFRVIKE